MKYPPAALTPFLAALPQKLPHPFRCQLLPSRATQGLSAGASMACALLNSLLALFSAPSLCFQWLVLRTLLQKHGGCGVSRTFCGTPEWVRSLSRHSSLTTRHLP